MIVTVPPRDVDLREWATTHGWPLSTVRGWSLDYDDFPAPSRKVGPGLLYLEAELNRWKRAHPELGRGRGGWNRKAGE